MPATHAATGSGTEGGSRGNTTATSPRAASAANSTGGAVHGERSASPQLTDDQILGLDTGAGQPRGAPPSSAAESEAQDGRAKAHASEDTKAREATAGEELAKVAAEPPELKELFDKNPELRRAWHAEHAYREVFPTVAEARELKKIFPTLADARNAAENLGELAQLDRWFFSPRAEDQAELVTTLARLDPRAFRGMAQAFPQVLSRMDPEAYRADTAVRVEATLADVRADAMQRGDETLAAAVDLLADRLFGHDARAEGGPAGSPASAREAGAPAENAALKDNAAAEAPHNLREAALARREQTLAAREAAAQQHATTEFYLAANAAVVENVLDAIKAQVGELVPEELSDGARNRVIGEIYREIDETLRGNRALAEQLQQAFRQGAYDSAHRRALVNLVAGRAKGLLPQVAKKVIGEWTSNVLAASRQKAARQRRPGGHYRDRRPGDRSAPAAQPTRPGLPQPLRHGHSESVRISRRGAQRPDARR